jgi:hypothetical protein
MLRNMLIFSPSIKYSKGKNMKYDEDFIIWLFENCTFMYRTEHGSMWIHNSENALDSSNLKSMPKMWEYWIDELAV